MCPTSKFRVVEVLPSVGKLKIHNACVAVRRLEGQMAGLLLSISIELKESQKQHWPLEKGRSINGSGRGTEAALAAGGGQKLHWQWEGDRSSIGSGMGDRRSTGSGRGDRSNTGSGMGDRSGTGSGRGGQKQHW